VTKAPWALLASGVLGVISAGGFATIYLFPVPIFTLALLIPSPSNFEDADVQLKARRGSDCGWALRSVESSFLRIQSRFQLRPQVSDVCDEAR
jgi:hypothetical protein